jgi:hypothetical protein
VKLNVIISDNEEIGLLTESEKAELDRLRHLFANGVEINAEDVNTGVVGVALGVLLRLEGDQRGADERLRDGGAGSALPSRWCRPPLHAAGRLLGESGEQRDILHLL